jgi:signal-transduction protein with cAMP-binding, CBS, and nucleotidyltransferase domain
MKIHASDIEKAFMLKSVQPFDKLDERTLFNMVSVMTLTKYEANTRLIDSETVSNEVMIVVDGIITTDSGGSVTIAGIRSVLEDTAIGEHIITNETGATCLRIGKGHFLTTMYECPFILVDLIKLRNQNPNYCL